MEQMKGFFSNPQIRIITQNERFWKGIFVKRLVCDIAKMICNVAKRNSFLSFF